MDERSGSAGARVTCPRCRAPLTEDRGYVAWCPACDWNVDPSAPAPPSTRRAERLAARVDAESDRALTRASGTGRGSGRDRLGHALLLAIAVIVHVVSLLVVLAGVALIVAARGFLGVFFGVLLITVAVLLRPRLGRIPKRAVTLTRTTAPGLFALLDEIGEKAGARPVQLVVLDEDFNAAYGHVGLRRRRVLWIGMPLWLVSTPDERLALLAHEIAHQVNGDARRGLLVSTAIMSLASWYEALRWTTVPEDGASWVDYGSWLVSWPFAKAIQLTLVAELRLSFRSHRRAEFEADRLAAEIASTAAMVAALDVLLLAVPCLRALQHVSRHGDGDLWGLLTAWRAGLPPQEWERLRRVDRRRGAAVDDTHPPTSHRVDALRARPPFPGEVVLDTENARRIDTDEVLPHAALIERRLRDRLRSDQLAI